MNVTITQPAIALSREDAARAIGMSLDSFERHVQPHVRMVRRGKLRLVPTSELTKWVEQNSEQVLPASTVRRPSNGTA